MDYPNEITPEILDKNKDVSNETIKEDIHETVFEVSKLKLCKTAYETLAKCHLVEGERRMYAFRESATEEEIRKRVSFIEFLRKLLAEREKLEKENSNKGSESG